MNKKKIVLGLTAAIGILLLLTSIIFIITSISIGNNVEKNCQQAQSQFEGDCVDALIQTVEADFKTNVSKNSAVWTLGQLGNDRALPLLQSKLMGAVPDREPWDKGISQYELSKAIKLLQGGPNITSIFWR